MKKKKQGIWCLLNLCCFTESGLDKEPKDSMKFWQKYGDVSDWYHERDGVHIAMMARCCDFRNGRVVVQTRAEKKWEYGSLWCRMSVCFVLDYWIYTKEDLRTPVWRKTKPAKVKLEKTLGKRQLEDSYWIFTTTIKMRKTKDELWWWQKKNNEIQ